MKFASTPKFVEEKISETRSRFTLEPLEPGFGYSLGNSIRRTLLSNIPGAAATSIRIEGVQHEFDSIPGIYEDTLEIVLNIKKLAISSSLDESVLGILTHKGEGVITAGDIKVPTGCEIHNKDLVIAHADKNAKFHLEITIEKGRGYVPASSASTDYSSGGQIALDQLYTPVEKVSYRVDPTRFEEYTHFDKLTIDITTKPSISPSDAIASAASTLIELMSLFKEIAPQVEALEFGETTFSQDPILQDSKLNDSIESIGLKKTTVTRLTSNGISTVQALVSKTAKELLDIERFGDSALTEVQEQLNAHGYSLAE